MINLDGLNRGDLASIARNHKYPESIRAYAHRKICAIDARIRGDIQRALEWEKQCDTIYNRLPESERW